VPLRVQLIMQPPCRPSRADREEGKRVMPPMVSAARWSMVMLPSGSPCVDGAHTAEVGVDGKVAASRRDRGRRAR